MAYDSSTFVTPSGHPGVTFLASSGDGGTPGGYPAFSPNVVAVGATELTMNGDSYGSETAWSFPTPRTLDNGSGSYSQFGSWASGSGGFSGTFSSAVGGSNSTAEWTTSIGSSDEGWEGGTEVSATWVPDPGNATNATYEIYDGSAASGTLLDTVTVDQTKAPQGTVDGDTQFQELGDYYPESGTITVVLSANSANGSVVADAVGIAPAWATAGGESQYESEPAYQFPVQSTGSRMTPDVSFDGSDNSGVTCYQNGRLEYDYYGTSLSSPCWAGIIAIANQGRVASGGTVFNSTTDPMQTLEALYSLPSSDFHEITSGYNGLFAGPGYDELTGLGSPIANLLVPDLVSYDTGAMQLVITAEPNSNVTAGSEFGLTVSVENISGDVLSSYSGEVTITLANNPGSGTLGGTLTLAVTNGMASFSDLTLDTAGTGYTLRASSSGLASLVTSPFNVTPAAAFRLVVSTEPSAPATAGQAFSTQPVIEEEDQYGNIETSDDSTVVTASLESGVGPLEGTAMVRLSKGVAVFSSLADDTAETITLIFKSGILQSATSSPITVSAATPSQLVIEIEPSSAATAGQAFLIQPVIIEEDQYGNIETTDDSTVVTVSLSSGTGPLQGTASVTVSDGVASFANLADNKAETITLIFKSSGLTSAASGEIAVSPATANRLVIETKPSSAATAGQAFEIQPVIEEEDQYGNVETSDNSTVVSVSLESGVGPLQGTNTATVSAGVASFSNLADNQAEAITLIFKSGSLKPAISSSINVSAAAPFQLVVQTQPSTTATAGQAFSTQPVVEEEDQFGNLETSDNGTAVSVSLSSGAGPLVGTNTATLAGGVAHFANLADNKAESITLLFQSGSLKAATSNGIDVSAAAPFQLAIQTQLSSTATAGQPFSTEPVIAEEDQYGNIEASDNGTVVSVSLESGAGPLEGTNTATLSAGVASFSGLADNKAETITLIFKSGSLKPAISSETTVSAAAPFQLVIQTQPSSTATAGQPFSSEPVIAEEDQYGNIEASDNTTEVTAALASGPGPLEGTTTVTVSDGVARFAGLADNKAESNALVFQSGSLKAATSSGITVRAAAPFQLVIQTQPSGAATAGQAFSTQPFIEEEDRYGNIEMSDNNTVVTAALASGTGPLEGMTSVSVSGGVASFADLADDRAESFSLVFESGALQVATSSDITVSPANPSLLVIQTKPSGAATAGQAFATQPVIEEEDQYGNLETSDNSTVVTASLSSGAGPLEGTTAATVAGGLAVFSNLAEDLAGSIALAFESGMLLAANSGLIVVSPAAATQLVIRTPQSSTATAGVEFATQPVIEEEDQYGNVETGDNSTPVTVSLNSGAGSLAGTSQVAVSRGVAAFTDLSDETAGSLSLLFSSGELLPAVSAATVVAPAPASQLVIHTQVSSTATAGRAFATQPVVEEEDQYGNLETSDNTTVVTASLQSGVGPLRGTVFASVSGGVAVFSNLADDKAETITLAFKSGNLQIATSGGIAVSAATPYQLVMETQPSSAATAGQAFASQPVVEEEDQYGNLETSDDSTIVTASLSSGAGPLEGTTTATVSGGSATFRNLADDKAETISLTFATGSLAATTATPVTIDPAALAALVVSDPPPSSVTAGAGFGFMVTAEDAFGNVVPAFAGSVVVALASNPHGDTLNGTLAVSAVDGVASFTGLNLDKATAGDTLRASSEGLAAAITNGINVTPAAADQLVVTSQPPANVAPEGGFSLAVTAEDRFGNTVTSETGSVTGLDRKRIGGALGGATGAPFVDGVATLTGLTLNKAGGYGLTISGDGLSAAVSSAFTVTPPPSISRVQILTTGKGKHKHFAGFQLFFTAALDPAAAENAANYTVTQTVKHGRKSKAKPVRAQALYNSSSNSVSLSLAGKPAFTLGGQIVVNAGPGGILDTSGTALDGNGDGIPGGNAVFTVLPKARNVVG